MIFWTTFGINVSIAGEQRDERVKVILESDVIADVKTILTSESQCRQLAICFLAELAKTGDLHCLFMF